MLETCCVENPKSKPAWRWEWRPAKQDGLITSSFFTSITAVVSQLAPPPYLFLIFSLCRGQNTILLKSFQRLPTAFRVNSSYWQDVEGSQLHVSSVSCSVLLPHIMALVPSLITAMFPQTGHALQCIDPFA